MNNSTFKFLYFVLFFIFCSFPALNAQNTEEVLNCAGDKMMRQFLKNNENQKLQKQMDEQIYRYLSNPNTLQTRKSSGIVTLPVVVHIIHNGGAENITNAQVLQGIKDLNDAFANVGYYDPSTGVNTEIQFCLAQRDPNNQGTIGITRDVSPLTNMTMETDDINLKNVNRWKTTCYINIWLVKEITSNSSGSGVAGYAYLPSAHGSNFDGIVQEARWFGSSPANTSVTIHEMGHYLGLYHTFNGDCKNDDCFLDGDHVCDTPPDQSRGASCNPNANSCTTDSNDPSVKNPFRAVSLGGKGDVADMGENYMDYSPFGCYSVFTQGQKDRMNWHIQNIRSSLLACKSCETPCPNPITASFTPRGQTIGVGTNLSFNNTSTNATSYKWKVGTTNYSTPNINHPFNTIGIFKVVLEASNADARCASAGDSVIIEVICPVKASITPLSSTVNPNTTVIFVATVQGATTTQWKVNGAVVGSGTTLNQLFTTVGNYDVEFTASNGFCSVIQKAVVVVNAANPSNCNDPFFAMTYFVEGGEISLNTVRQDVNNTFVAVGKISKTGFSSYEPMILKIDAVGKIIWAKRVSTNEDGVFYNMRTTKDGGYIAVGTLGKSPLITKFSPTGSTEWSFSTQSSGPGDYFRQVIQLSDGSYAASGTIDLNTNAIVAKFQANGTPQWTREIGSSTSDWSVGLEETNDGNLIVSSNTTSTTNNYLVKLNATDGNFIWQKQYSTNATNPCCSHTVDDISKSLDGNFLIVGGWDNNVVLFQKVDNSGNVLWTKSINQSGLALRGTHVLATSDGGYIVSSGDYNNGYQHNILKLDNNFKVQWQKNIGTGGDLFLKGVVPLTDGSYLIGFNEVPKIAFSKVNALGVSCETTPNSAVNISDVRSQVSDGSFSNNAGRAMTPIQLETSPIDIKITNRCKECKEICGNGIDDDNDGLIDNADVLDCPCNKCFLKDSVKIAGIDTACYNTNFTYKLRGFQCNKFKTNWIIAGNGVNIVAKTDTFLTVNFTKGTAFNLKAVIQDSCSIDTILSKTYVIGAPPVLDLGADKTVCQTGVFTFNAKKGFKSYVWQDFSTDSIFTAFGAGKYWVRVTDSCGGVQSDTVNVNQIIVPDLKLSPNVFKICEGESINVVAQTGFATYRWSPKTGVNDTFQRTVSLTPSVSSKYYCAVSTALGCVSLDSIFVGVTPLNRDSRVATICANQNYKIGDSTFTKAGNYLVKLKNTKGGCDTLLNLTLNTINNFTRQIDSTICTKQSIKIGDSTFTKVGNYNVLLRGRLGACDTFVSVNLKAPNVVQQTVNKIICLNGKFKIGDSTFAKSGIYKVFINNILCKDTVITVNLEVTNLKIQTTAIPSCPNQESGRISTVVNGATSAVSYLWNNGKTTTEITNLAPGTYRLTVTDINKCSDTTTAIIKATPQYSYSFSVKTPTCFGDANGEIKVNSTESFAISIDSIVFNRSGILKGLKAGNYPIYVKDTNNCIFKETISFNQPPILTVTLPLDTIIRLGDSLKIKAIANTNNPLKYFWQPSRNLNCDTCETVIAKPTSGITYSVTVKDAMGCQATDDIYLRVNRECNIYIPNAFSPFNSLSFNDTFFPNGGDCAKEVAVMQIYDRWGELVFLKRNFPLNTPSLGWDGTFKDKPLMPGVYVYIIEIIIVDGHSEIFTGDVTLVK